MLVFGIFRINHLDRLPATSAVLGIVDLKRSRRDEHQQRQTLRIHTRLDKLLRPADRRATDQRQRYRQARHPRRRDDGVAIVAAPSLETLVSGLVLAQHLRRSLAGILVRPLGILHHVQVVGQPLGVEDGAEAGRGREEECARRQTQAAEDGVASRGGEDGSHAEPEAGCPADDGALEDCVELCVFDFFAAELHACVVILQKSKC